MVSFQAQRTLPAFQSSGAGRTHPSPVPLFLLCCVHINSPSQPGSVQPGHQHLLTLGFQSSLAFPDCRTTLAPCPPQQRSGRVRPALGALPALFTPRARWSWAGRGPLRHGVEIHLLSFWVLFSLQYPVDHTSRPAFYYETGSVLDGLGVEALRAL